MFLSRGDRDLGVAFQTHPGRQAFISSGSKEARSLSAKSVVQQVRINTYFEAGKIENLVLLERKASIGTSSD